MGFQNLYRMRFQELMNRVLGILEVGELAGAGGADLAARSRQALGDAVIAEGAFLCGIGFGIDEAATEAITFVYEHDSIGRDKGCADGTNLRAGRIRTVVAELGDKEILAADFIGGETLLAAVRRFHLGPFNLPVGDVVALNPSAVIALGDVVFFGAGADATAAANALGNIDQHAPPVLGEFVVGGGLGGAG